MTRMITLAPDFASENTVDELGVTLDVSERFHGNRLEIPLPIPLFIKNEQIRPAATCLSRSG